MELLCKQVILAAQMESDLSFKLAKSLHPREQLSLMKKFASSDSLRVGILYGLRRTGKTILLKQWLQSLPPLESQKAAYISVEEENMFAVKHDLQVLSQNGYKYVAIDEITTCEDFISGSVALSNRFANSGLKIFIAGTDSLSLWFAISDKLFDRDYTLHTSYISFA